MSKIRKESDSVGSLEIPLDAYYGVQSLRAHRNFCITGQSMASEQIKALALIKKAAARANAACGRIRKEQSDAIEQACDEIIEGKLHDQFICDPIQGGAGTSANMNANEVIANRAGEILGDELGSYKKVHPNDTVNCGQSTNDVYPTSGKLAALHMLDDMYPKVEKLAEAFEKKAAEFDDVIKVGRTQLQDAVPIRLGQEFAAYACMTRRGLDAVKKAADYLLDVNMAATAIGTGITASKEYAGDIVPLLAEISGYKLRQSKDLIDGTQNLDSYIYVSGAIKGLAAGISKIANDLRLMSSGPRAGLGEINLPARQNGSSIMPGKINPVIPEVVSQVCYSIFGNDVCIHSCVEAGQLELNAFEPVMFHKLFENIRYLGNACETLRVNCIEGIEAKRERCKELLENSLATVTALTPSIGYVKSASIAKEAMASGKTLREVLSTHDDLPADINIDKLLEATHLTVPLNE